MRFRRTVQVIAPGSWPPKRVRVPREETRETPEGRMLHAQADSIYPPGECWYRMRTPGSISCFWQCHLPAGHAGAHRWATRDGSFKVSFTDTDGAAAAKRRPSIDEIDAWESRGTPGSPPVYRITEEKP